MAGTSAPNLPAGHPPGDKVRLLQRQLWAAAKRQPGRRFHALMDRVWRGDVLREAWARVRRNHGAAGVDAQTLADVEAYGVDRLLAELQSVLRAGTYRPRAVLRRYIPKADGRQRPLGIPTVRDRIVQAAARLVLEPIFEADFLPCSYGFRPKRSAPHALEALRRAAAQGGNHVLDADIQDYFGSIDHARLLALVARRIADRRVLKLVRQWLQAGVMEEGREVPTLAGTPQGGVISPLLANIYLHVLDRTWAARFTALGQLVRYCDDFVIICRTRAACAEAERQVARILRDLQLVLHPTKTRRVELSWGRQGFDFLGCHLRKRLAGRLWTAIGKRLYFLQRWPSAKSMQRVRQRVRELTDRRWSGVKDVRVLIAHLNPVLRGWGAYFRSGNAAKKFDQVDTYVWQRLVRFLARRKGRHLRAGEVLHWDRAFFYSHGLYRLYGTVQYPEAA